MTLFHRRPVRVPKKSSSCVFPSPAGRIFLTCGKLKGIDRGNVRPLLPALNLLPLQAKASMEKSAFVKRCLVELSGIDHVIPSLVSGTREGRQSPSPADNARSENDELLRATDAARLSRLAPRIRAVLEEMAGPESNVPETLSSNIGKLQESFIEGLYSVLSEEAVDFSSKLTLHLNEDNALAVAGTHPDKEKVENALAGRPALAAVFREIASQSELLRDISNISKVMTRQTGIERYARSGTASSFAVYRMSLKGEMSHFYFTRSG
jgi:hypothetical protein